MIQCPARLNNVKVAVRTSIPTIQNLKQRINLVEHHPMVSIHHRVLLLQAVQ
uniref:Uncharacterized protein n=1 Tax=Arundo donax TaxID=35708 RepID=A0A0A9A3D6_ARUDO